MSEDEDYFSDENDIDISDEDIQFDEVIKTKSVKIGLEKKNGDSMKFKDLREFISKKNQLYKEMNNLIKSREETISSQKFQLLGSEKTGKRGLFGDFEWFISSPRLKHIQTEFKMPYFVLQEMMSDVDKLIDYFKESLGATFSMLEASTKQWFEASKKIKQAEKEIEDYKNIHVKDKAVSWHDKISAVENRGQLLNLIRLSKSAAEKAFYKRHPITIEMAAEGGRKSRKPKKSPEDKEKPNPEIKPNENPKPKPKNDFNRHPPPVTISEEELED